MLTQLQTGLLAQARQVASRAYAPYSHFRVGAAVLAGGRVFLGVNVENASYGLSLCAERAALAAAVAAGITPEAIEGVAVVCLDAESSDPAAGSPCGGCRQWLAELAPRAWIVAPGWDEAKTAADLLPLGFRL